MGLNINWYRELKKASAKQGLKADGQDVKDGYTRFWIVKDFAGRAPDIEDGAPYKFEKEGSFRAGSYSGYNHWRAWLASLAGYTPEDAWSGNAEGKPFVELVDFSDCEGVIGAKVSAKLAEDFATWQEKADRVGDEWQRRSYKEWRNAFEQAAQNGAVQFC